MIIYWLAKVVFFIVGAVLNVIPLPGVPDWLDTSSQIAEIFGQAQHLGAWFPVSLVSTILLFVLAFNLVGFLVHLVRMCISLFTGGGGAVTAG